MWTKTVDKIAKTEREAMEMAYHHFEQFPTDPDFDDRIADPEIATWYCETATWYCDCGESLALFFNTADGDTLTIGICEACYEHEHA